MEGTSAGCRAGVDGVVVDAPCSGTATTRKNRELWRSWTPKVGRSLFQLQSDIAFRAAQLLRPGGRMVCSLAHSTQLKTRQLCAIFCKDAVARINQNKC